MWPDLVLLQRKTPFLPVRVSAQQSRAPAELLRIRVHPRQLPTQGKHRVLLAEDVGCEQVGLPFVDPRELRVKVLVEDRYGHVDQERDVDRHSAEHGQDDRRIGDPRRDEDREIGHKPLARRLVVLMRELVGDQSATRLLRQSAVDARVDLEHPLEDAGARGLRDGARQPNGGRLDTGSRGNFGHQRLDVPALIIGHFLFLVLDEDVSGHGRQGEVDEKIRR